MSTILDMGRGTVAHQEKRAWIMLVVTLVVYPAYVVLVLRAAAGGPLVDVAYASTLLWSIGIAIAANIALDIATSLGTPRGEQKPDVRDREIARIGDLTGQSFLVIGAVAGDGARDARVRPVLDRQRDLPRLRAVRRARLGDEDRRLPRELLDMVKPTRVTNSIRVLRFAHGEMTQADLAERIGVTRQTVIAIEQGKYSPSLEVAFQIAHVLGVPLDDVFQYPDSE